MIVAFLENSGFVSHAKTSLIYKQELNSRREYLTRIFLLCQVGATLGGAF